MSDAWYYVLSGQQRGPASAADVRQLLSSGQLAGDALAWREGMAQWAPIATLTELSAPIIQSPTPSLATPLTYGGYEKYPSGPLGDERRGIHFGGFWIRVLACIVDSLVLFIPNRVVSTIFKEIGGPPLFGPSGGSRLPFIGFALSLSLVPLILDWLYFALMESSPAQATLGKMLCGLVVTDACGDRLTFGRATARYFAKILSRILLCIGYIMVAFDDRKRGLHDIIAKTFVVWKGSLQRRS